MKVENARCNAGDPIVPQEIQIGQIPETLEFVHNNDSAALPARDSWAFGARVMVDVAVADAGEPLARCWYHRVLIR